MRNRKLGFHSTFNRIGDGRDFSPGVWADSFRPSARPLWKHDLGGSIRHHGEDGLTRALILEYLDPLVSVSYDDTTTYWIASPDGILASEFTLTDHGATVPTDSGLTLEAAWPIVNGFLVAPHRRPEASWIDAQTLEWPEDY